MSLLSSHIPFERLVDLVEARLPVTEQAQLQTHISTCQRCGQEVARLERLLNVMRSDRSADAPPQVLARAVRLFRPQGQAAAENPLRRILAALQFDSQSLTPALGLRAEGTAARQFLFTAAEYDVDIRITPAGNAWSVMGQVLGEDEASGRVILVGTTGVTETILNAQSEFVLPSVPAGHYRLTFHLPTVEIAVDTLHVGA